MARLATVLALLTLLLATGIVQASPVLSTEAPPWYTPGTSFQTLITLPGADALASFNIELVLSSGAGVAGVDYKFMAAVQPASPRYVFDGQAVGGFAGVIQPGHEERITMGDFLTALPAGVTTVAGANDRVAVVTVWTAATFSAPLTISVDPASLQLDTWTFTPIAGFDGLVSSLQPAVVTPEPASLLFLAGGLAAAAVRRRRRI